MSKQINTFFSKPVFRYCLICVCMFAYHTGRADTLFVQAHHKVDLVNHSNYDQWAYFPGQGKTFRKVYMLYTLGCASGGCSDWDYDVNNFLLHNSGRKDSSIAGLDTVSTDPLQVDTTWNVFDVIERFELGRFITPYGTYMNFRNPQYGVAGFDSSWQHTFIFDVTDYQTLMNDSVMVRSQYNGWSSGFSASIVFVMIEGIPQRDVISIQNVYAGGGGYQNSEQFESAVCPEKTFDIPEGTKQAQVKVIVSGHGANQAEGCGEFCDKYYEYLVNGVVRFKTRMWRDDCGKVAVAPQGGTWIFSRGNWCPGDKVYEDRHEITPYLEGDSLKLNLNIEPYVLQGSGASSHNLSSTVFFYGSHNKQFDAEIETVISPSTFSEHIPFNPSCGKAIIVIKNNGPAALTYARIEYGPKGGIMRRAEWNGLLGFEERDTLFLEAPYWSGVDPEQTEFVVRIYNQNHRYSDEDRDNDVYTTGLELVPRLEPFRIILRTNGVPQENRLSITNELGEEVFTMENLSPNTLYQEDLNLPDGCYELLLTDAGGDGLHFWYWANAGYPQGLNGFIRLTKQGGGIYENFGGDFGAELRYGFIIGEMSIPEKPLEESAEAFLVFPNPATAEAQVQLPGGANGRGTLRVINNLGQVVYELKDFPTDQSYWISLDISKVNSGLYHIELILGESRYYSKLIIAN